MPEDEEDDGEDIWLSQNELPATKPGPRLWARFYDRSYKEPNQYLSEAGPLVFAAALQQAHECDGKPAPTIIQAKPMVTALALVGLGLESLFFEYDDAKRSFKARFSNITIAGLSQELMKDAMMSFVSVGNDVRRLHWYVQWCYESTKSTPTRIALAKSIKDILNALKGNIIEALPSVKSLLQLRYLFKKPSSLVKYVLQALKTTRDLHSQEDVLSKVYDLAQNCEFRDAWAQPLMLGLLARVSSPWLGSLSASLGLRSSERADEELLKRLQHRIEIIADEKPRTNSSNPFPSFIAEEEQERILKACSSLVLLKQHHSDHILSQSGRNQFTQGPRLEWHFDWTDVDRVQQRAIGYESRIRAAMRAKLNYTTVSQANLHPVDDSWSPYGKSDVILRRQFNATYDVFDALPEMSKTQNQDGLQRHLKDIFSPSVEPEESQIDFSPPLSLVSIISFRPIIAVQSRLINHACLRMMFKKYDLTTHLSLQHSFQLLGSGLFSTRLSESLFSSSMSSAERQKDHVRVGNFGLRLSTRKTWPPQTSELQLALAGVLSDSYHDETASSSNLSPPSKSPKKQQANVCYGTGMPGDLSWSVRHLGQTDAQACLEQHSLYALDFLRLQYRPPAPLDTVISEVSLEKYDSIFKLLLRVLRLIFVTKQLSISAMYSRRSTRSTGVESRFRIEATYFVNTVADYFFHSVIATSWVKFWDRITDLEGRLAAVDGFDQIRDNESVFSIRALHENMLDSMRLGLLVRYKQRDVAQILMQIFELILRFARLLEEKHDIEANNNEPTVEELYNDFGPRVGDFVEGCKELRLKPEYTSSKDYEEDTIDQLIFRLDMNGRYSKQEGL